MTDYYSSYFLGANSAKGFYSLYDHFINPEQDFIWVIKGGPGCGKSTFMKRVAQSAETMGLDVEYVLCSGDPDSVDGIYIPAWKTAYVDGTAPHVQEVAVPAAGGAYLDLGRFYDRQPLYKKKEKIMQLMRDYRAIYHEIYEILNDFSPKSQNNHPSWRRCATIKTRFYRAITCKGLLNLYPRRTSMLARDAADELAQAAVEVGQRVIDVRHPLFPDITEAIYLPSAQALYRIDCEEDDATLRAAAAIVCPMLARAKALHDELEAVYNPYVNFSAVSNLSQKHIEMLKSENIGL